MASPEVSLFSGIFYDKQQIHTLWLIVSGFSMLKNVFPLIFYLKIKCLLNFSGPRIAFGSSSLVFDAGPPDITASTCASTASSSLMSAFWSGSGLCNRASAIARYLPGYIGHQGWSASFSLTASGTSQVHHQDSWWWEGELVACGQFPGRSRADPQDNEKTFHMPRLRPGIPSRFEPSWLQSESTF